MMVLLKNAEIFTPKPIGKGDVLLEGNRIIRVQPHIQLPAGIPDLVEIDGEGKYLVPGFIDLHTHVLGGGGEDGFSSRAPESRLTDFTTVGVTTALAMLGTDGVARSLESLFAKSKALTEEGMTCLMLTGSYRYPSPTLCGDVERDVVLVDRVVGAKIALSDHRSSEITYDELLRLATMVRRGGMLAGKAGLLTIHVGGGKGKLDKLFRAAEESEVPLSTFLPTHVGRTPALLSEAIRWIKQGGNADFTAGKTEPGGTARQIAFAISQGAAPERITLSSDAFGSLPRFDDQGRCIGLTYGTSSILREELVRMVESEKMPLETALGFLTSNPARVLHLDGCKGCIAPGADADLLLLNKDLSIDAVFAMGRQMVQGGRAIVTGRFE